MATPIGRRFPIWAESDGVRVEFVDDGAPFDPTIAPAKRINGRTDDFEIGGYGTGLVQKFSRRMSYRRSDGHEPPRPRIRRRRNANAGPEVAQHDMMI